MSDTTATAEQKPPNLFRQRNFALLFTGQTASLFGTQITYVAVPLTAVLLLHATPMQAGILAALDMLPFLLFGLFVGVWLDRRSRRPVVIVADLVRAVALAWIPIAHVLGVLTMLQLFVVVFIVGTMTVFFDVAFQSYVPGLLGREQLMQANGKMMLSESSAQVAGPGLAGVLISTIGAPATIVADVVTYVLSFVTLAGLPADKAPEPQAGAESQSVFASIREGFAAIGRNSLLVWITTTAVVSNFFSAALLSVFFLYLVDIGMSAAQVGLIVAVGSVGALLGAILTGRLTGKFGAGPMIIVALTLPVAGYLILAAVKGNSPADVAAVAAASLIAQFGIPIFNVTVVSFRQVLTPDELLGRVTATARTGVLGSFALGSLAGGAFATATDLRTTILAGTAGVFAAAMFLLLFSPVRSARGLFDEADTATGADADDLTTTQREDPR